MPHAWCLLMTPPWYQSPGPDASWWSGAAVQCRLRWQQNCSIAKTHPESFNWLFLFTPFNQCHQSRFYQKFRYETFDWIQIQRYLFRQIYKIFDSGRQTNWCRVRVKEEKSHKNKRTGPMMWAMTATSETFISRTNMDFTNTIHPITNNGQLSRNTSHIPQTGVFFRKTLSKASTVDESLCSYIFNLSQVYQQRQWI